MERTKIEISISQPGLYFRLKSELPPTQIADALNAAEHVFNLLNPSDTSTDTPSDFAPETPHLRPSERALLKSIEPGGLSERRDIIAKRIGCTLHTVNIAITKLKKRGLITTTTTGRYRDQPALIEITAAGQKAIQQAQEGS